MKMQMEDLIEYLQIKLAESFGEDDDNVIEKLRENMHELISNKMIYPGKPPQEELPEKPFGMVDDLIKHDLLDDDEELLPQEKKPKEWTVHKEAGLRSGTYSDSNLHNPFFQKFQIVYGN